jgi:hypothetical protein
VKENQSLRFLAVALVAAALSAGSLTYAQEAAETPARKLSFMGEATDDGQAQSAKQPTSQSAAASSDEGWHLVVSPYLWFPGVHGTIGARDNLVSIHASAADLLSHFRFGLMGAADLSYKRLLAPIEMMWVRLGDDKALPGIGLGAITANVKASEFILTPKIGFRVLKRERLTIDALTGFRTWHLGQNLQFSPSRLGLQFQGSQNWVDPLIGGRIQVALTTKMEVTIAGDVGGWGAGSQLDYQVVGLLGYKIKPKWTLQAGYRYLDVNYRSGGGVFDVAMSGVLFGVNINVK